MTVSFPPVRGKFNFLNDLLDATPKSANKEATKPVKHILEKQKFNYLTSDPENNKGHDLIRNKFGL